MIDEILKPSDWPINAKEHALERINSALLFFIDNPGYRTKEILVSLVSQYDLNQKSYFGLYRVTEYEVAIINCLYIYENTINLKSLSLYLYGIIGDTIRTQKAVSKMKHNDFLGVEVYQHLFPPLRLYSNAYYNFKYLKNRRFADQLIATINQILSEGISEDNLFLLTKSYVLLLHDLSYFRCKKSSTIWAFSRDELIKLFRLEAKLLKMNHQSAIVRTQKGVLMPTISNYILKSRNSYNAEYIYKFVSESVAEKSIENHEIWMSEVEHLNDKRELKVVPELFSNKQWLDYKWARNITFSPVRNYYVSSFCKTSTDARMHKTYGSCVYGYKNDKLAELLAPIKIHKNGNERLPSLSQVLSFDVIYDTQEAQQEINFLCSIIDLFQLTPTEKTEFFQAIMQYWLLSVKDKKWSYERERRYVLFLYDDYDYIELDQADERFLKLRTTALTSPDFILGDNPSKFYIKSMIDERRRAISAKNYMFCSNCFSCDFDAVYKEYKSCPICGSSDFHLVEVIKN